MLVEMHRKVGCLCEPARNGQLRCPLIIRSSSEDVITGELVQAFNVLNPRYWLPDFLNEALGARRFQGQIFRRLQVEPWYNMPTYPRELLPWDEGSTQVDIRITWENPPTTVFIEMKYGAGLSPRTAGDSGEHGFSSNQLIRNARVGLLECGYFKFDQLFAIRPRDFVLVLASPERGNRLVRKYRDPDLLKADIPHNDRLWCLPRRPFIGELSYGDISRILRRQRRWFSRPEQKLVDMLLDYLDLKRVRKQAEPTELGIRVRGMGNNLLHEQGE